MRGRCLPGAGIQINFHIMVQEIASLCEALGVEQLYLFGSATRESTLAEVRDNPYLRTQSGPGTIQPNSQYPSHHHLPQPSHPWICECITQDRLGNRDQRCPSGAADESCPLPFKFLLNSTRVLVLDVTSPSITCYSIPLTRTTGSMIRLCTRVCHLLLSQNPPRLPS